MRLETSKWINTPDIADEDFVYHKNARFFSVDLENRPEFMFKNHLIDLKEKEIGLIEDYLKKLDEEDERAKSAIQNTVTPGKAGGKAPAKGAPKAAPQKGAPADDKNAPQQIEVNYPEVPTEKNYFLIEKDFNMMRPKDDGLPT